MEYIFRGCVPHLFSPCIPYPSSVVRSIETATKHGGVAGAVLPCAAEARTTRTGGRSTETSSRHVDTRGTAIAIINMQSCL
jgi:hypothetical protein